jgi:stage IV sporulation protein FB
MIKRSYLLATIAHIPIRAHITLLLLFVFLALSFGGFGVFYAAVVFASVLLHELGHAAVTRLRGGRVKEILLLPIGGVAVIDRLPTRPADELLIASAGPAVSLLLALVFHRLEPLSAFFISMRNVNLALALFNLLPAFPMDGGRILRALLTLRMGRRRATELAARSGRILACLMGVVGLFGLHNVLKPNFFLVIIAIVIYRAAGREYRACYKAVADYGNLGEPADIEVGPPPYERSRWKNPFRFGRD